MTELKPPHDPIEALGQSYELMLEESIKDLHKIEDKSAPVIHDLIANAKEKLSAAGELSHEEAERIGEYLERDLVDAGRYLAETGRELKDWLGFETALIEDEFLLMLQQAADQTQLEWLKLRLQAQAERPSYKTGEVVAPGTFVCLKCGEEIHLHKAGHLPPCPKCAATGYRRTDSR